MNIRFSRSWIYQVYQVDRVLELLVASDTESLVTTELANRDVVRNIINVAVFAGLSH